MRQVAFPGVASRGVAGVVATVLALVATVLLTPSSVAHAATDTSPAWSGSASVVSEASASSVEGWCTDAGVRTFGPASTTAAIVGATVHDDNVYVVSRGLVPPVLAEIDGATKKVVRTVELPSGEGGWATTVSGGQIYVGMYPVPDVHRFDPATGEVLTVARLGGSSGYVWALTTATDGTVYAATYPDGGIWEIRTDTHQAVLIARPVPGAQYARYIAADDTHVYASVYTPGRLVAIDRRDHSVRYLNPPELGDQSYGPITVDGDRLITTSSHKLITMRTDGSEVLMVELPDSEVLIDALAVGPDATIYATTRRSGSLYRYRPGATEMARIATPAPYDEHRAIVLLDESTMVGAAGSGAVWWLDVNGGTFTYVDLIEAGFPPGPERPQAIAVTDDGTVYVGGHWAVEVHQPSTGTSTRVRVPGEVKAMLVHDGLVYMALYPSTELVALDTATLEVHRFGTILHDQQRPWDMDYDERTGLIVVASAPGTGLLEGALTVFDPRTGDMDVYPGIIEGQSIMSVDAVDGVAYLGGDVLGGGGVSPTRDSASVVAFDLRTRSVLWEIQPLPGHRTTQDVIVDRGILYGVMKREAGTWFALDLPSRTVRQQGFIGSYGETFVHRGRVFATVFTGQIFQLGPSLSEPLVVADGLGDMWYTNPQLAPEAGWYGWGIKDRDLAWIRIDPRCGVPVSEAGALRDDAAVRIGDVM
jgi:outer membrane protein assembly factor BamB